MVNHWTRNILITFCAVTLGCTSTLNAVSGRYAYFEVVDGEVVNFSWNPMSQRYSQAVLEGADPTTFIAINNSHGKDASQVFKKSRPLLTRTPLPLGFGQRATRRMRYRSFMAALD